MRIDRYLQQRLGQVASLQAMKATTSQALLLEAQSDTLNARDALALRNEVVDTIGAKIEALFASDSLDLPSLRISGAMLDAATVEQALAAGELTLRETGEEQRRGVWNLDRQRENQADRLNTKAKRRLANWRDETASADAIDLQIARKRGRGR